MQHTAVKWAELEAGISSCRLAAVKRKMGATNGLFGVLRPAEVPCFYNDLGVVRKTAKPLCAGSIPARASNPLNNLREKNPKRINAM